MSESHNPDWNKNIMPKEQRLPNESIEAYYLRLMSRSDINFFNAKKNYDRPPYYKRFLTSAQEDLNGE